MLMANVVSTLLDVWPGAARCCAGNAAKTIERRASFHGFNRLRGWRDSPDKETLSELVNRFVKDFLPFERAPLGLCSDPGHQQMIKGSPFPGLLFASRSRSSALCRLRARRVRSV